MKIKKESLISFFFIILVIFAVAVFGALVVIPEVIPTGSDVTIRAGVSPTQYDALNRYAADPTANGAGIVGYRKVASMPVESSRDYPFNKIILMNITVKSNNIHRESAPAQNIRIGQRVSIFESDFKITGVVIHIAD